MIVHLGPMAHWFSSFRAYDPLVHRLRARPRLCREFSKIITQVTLNPKPSTGDRGGGWGGGAEGAGGEEEQRRMEKEHEQHEFW